MKLYTNRELLDRAKENQYAVGTFNISNLEILQAIVSAGELERSPAIVAVSEGAIQYAGLPQIVSMVRVAAQVASIPISLHLDHGKNLEIIQSCIESGFTSVMIDGSRLEFDENVAFTNKVVHMARRKTVSVEAKWGRLKGIEEKIFVSDQEAFLTAPSPEAQFC